MSSACLSTLTSYRKKQLSVDLGQTNGIVKVSCQSRPTLVVISVDLVMPIAGDLICPNTLFTNAFDHDWRLGSPDFLRIMFHPALPLGVLLNSFGVKRFFLFFQKRSHENLSFPDQAKYIRSCLGHWFWVISFKRISWLFTINSGLSTEFWKWFEPHNRVAISS